MFFLTLCSVKVVAAIFQLVRLATQHVELNHVCGQLRLQSVLAIGDTNMSHHYWICWAEKYGLIYPVVDLQQRHLVTIQWVIGSNWGLAVRADNHLRASIVSSMVQGKLLDDLKVKNMIFMYALSSCVEKICGVRLALCVPRFLRCLQRTRCLIMDFNYAVMFLEH